MLLITYFTFTAVSMTRGGVIGDLRHGIPKRNGIAVRRSTHVTTLVNSRCIPTNSSRRGIVGDSNCHVRICTKGGAHRTGGRTCTMTAHVGRRFPRLAICASFGPPH